MGDNGLILFRDSVVIPHNQSSFQFEVSTIEHERILHYGLPFPVFIPVLDHRISVIVKLIPSHEIAPKGTFIEGSVDIEKISAFRQGHNLLSFHEIVDEFEMLKLVAHWVDIQVCSDHIDNIIPRIG